MYAIRSLCAAVLAATITFASAGAADAGATHETYTESYDGSFAMTAEENPCGAWAATLHEVRSGSIKLVTAPGGREEGEYHVNGVIEGTLELVPDDATLPTYSGRYREKINAVITGFDPDSGDVARVAQYRLRSRLTGDGGQRLTLTLSGKLTVAGTGVLVVNRDALTCG